MPTEKKNEPIAIVGMGCRLPGGANDLDDFWQLLLDGRDAITETPADRWDKDELYHPDYTRHGKINVKWGGFVDNLDKFDAQFFSISPMEAKRVDPQQRMLLETSYRAMEDAGLRVEELSGKKVGVFLGISAHDYGDISFHPSERVNIDGKTISGGSASIAANRISYVFNFVGPSVAMDTACSSSLLATHFACRSILDGDCEMALIAGVNSLIKPEISMSFSTGGFLSPDGRCKTFDSRANGYIRSEGVGVLVAKPLSKAIADGDKIYTTIIGTATNQDGLTDGISMPNVDAQKAVLKDAYAWAELDPVKVQYVEAHGTGTKVGDPIEANALGELMGERKENGEKLVIGSVKSNIGHLEPASGVAGLIKLSMAMKKKQIPKNVNFKTPNPKIEFERFNLKVPTELTPWPEVGGETYAGINSFGFGGANAHAVLKGYYGSVEGLPKQDKDVQLFTISGRSSGALTDYAEAYISYLKTTEDSLADICYTQNVRRSHHAHKLAVAVRTKEELVERLEAFLLDEARPGMTHGRVNNIDGQPKVAFICSGQGPQWWGMARDLIAKEPVFKKTVEECEKVLKSIGCEWSLIEEMGKDEESSRIDETDIAQPALFTVQVGLYRLWESFGVKADAVVGHSIGEVASAHISGQLSFEEAVKVIYHRSRVQNMASGKGKMLAVGLSEEEAAKLIVGNEDKVSVATINGPTLVTLSGNEEVLQTIADDLDSKDIFYRFLVVKVPFHSPYMEPLKDELFKALADIKFNKADIPLYSTVTGDLYEGNYDAAYWYENVRDSVKFTKAMDSMIRDGITTFVELAPHPILLRYIDEMLDKNGVKGTGVGSIRRKEDEGIQITGNLGALYASGYEVDWKTFQGGGEMVDVPAYPFQWETYWVETPTGAHDRKGKRFHPLLREHNVSARDANDHTWDVDLDKRLYPFIEDHRVQGPLVYPGAGSCEVTIACGREAFGDDFAFIEDINFRRAVFLPDEGTPPEIQLNIAKDDGAFAIYSREPGDEWTKHIWGNVKHHDEAFDHKELDLDAIRKRVNNLIDMTPMYDELFKCGLQLGPTFRGVTELYRANTDDGLGESYGIVVAPEGIKDEIHQFNIHPSMLDACFQTLFGAPERDPDAPIGVMIPVHIDRFKFYKKATETLYVYGRGTEKTDMHMTGDISIFDENGEIVIEIQGFQCRFLEGTRGEDAKSIDNTIYKWKWNLNELLSTKAVRDTNEILPSLKSIDKDMQGFLKEVREREEMKTFNTEFEPLLNKLTAQYIERAFAELGFEFKKGNKITAEEFCKKYKVVDEHHRLVAHCFMILAESGVLKGKKGAAYTVVADLEMADTEAFYEELFAKYKPFHHELIMLHRCGPHLKEIFSGESIAVRLLFPEAEWDAIVDYYREGYSFKKYNEIIQRAFKNLLADMPKDKTLRILEIGAGTGGVTNAILPVLPADRTVYTFTDVSSMFLHQAERGFEEYSFVEYDVLDISGDAEEQGFVPNSYDIVVASDVLHATEYIEHNLQQISKMLAPGGMLCMLEVTGCPWYTDLIFGLTEGWWMYQDTDLRPDHATMNQKKWLSVFDKLKFGEKLLLSDTDREDISAQTVFLVKNAEVQPVEQTITLPEDYNGDGQMLIFKDKQGVGDYIAGRFEKLGEKCITVEPGDKFSYSSGKAVVNPEKAEDFVSLFDSLDKDGIVLDGVLHCWNMNYPTVEDMTTEELNKSLYVTNTSIIEISNNLHKDGDPKKGFQFWIATANAQNVTEYSELALAQSGAWGLTRSFIHEHQNIHIGIMDLSKDITEEEKAGLFEQIVACDGAQEAAMRGKLRYLHKFVKSTPTEERREAERKVSGYDTPYHLVTHEQGVLDNLHYEEMEKKVLADDEVEIQPKAMGLNFKDVMIAMGLLHEDAPKGGYTGYTYGMECTGVVSAVGSKVKDVKVGDRVMAISADSFSSQVVTKAIYTAPIPDSVSFEEAGTIPFAYITAYYSLNYMARMEKGDKVLIHSASGGVGTAAVKLAQAMGCEIFATAGSEERREYVRSLGVKHVYDSRGLTFGDEILADTNGEGVDIVLNSLAGTSIYKSISCMNHYGRLVEIGKTDIYDNNTISLRPFSRNLSYMAVDIDKLLTQKPELCGKLYKECMAQFKDNCPPAHPFHSFSVDKVTDAFNFMAGVRHIGKVLVVNDGEEVKVSPATDVKAMIKPDGAYVITGGFSGLGMEVADWLVRSGVKHLAVLSRSGAKTDEAKEYMKRWEKQGCEVLEGKCDAGDAKAMEKVFKDVKKMGPVRGIIHSAMVLDDCLMKDMTMDRFMKAAQPKILGAWNLHNNTKDEPVDFFLNFSSIAGQWGSPAQANYSSGNVFLDMMAYHRNAMGMIGNTISWGVIGKVGFVSRSAGTEEILDSQGWRPYSPEQAIKVVEWMILSRFTHRGAIDADWSAIAEYFNKDKGQHRFKELLREDVNAQNAGGGSLLETLANADEEKRESILRDQVADRVARILGTSAGSLDLEEPISNMGLDSLMANQLRNWIQGAIDVDYSMMRIMRGPSIIEMTQQLLDEISAGSGFGGGVDNRTETEKWFNNANTKEDANFRLFCFPYMGGGASSFAQWNAALPGSIEAVSVQFPGREDRLEEECYNDIEALTDTMVKMIEPLMDKPYAFYGHSIGAAVAYKLAAKLEAAGKRKPEHVFVAGWLAPHLESPFDIIKGVPEADIMADSGIPTIKEHMRSLEIPEDVVGNDALMQELLPSIRADIVMGLRLESNGMNATVKAPLTAIAGAEDTVFAVETVEAWKKHSKDFDFLKVKGGHLFMRESRDLIFKKIQEKLLG